MLCRASPSLLTAHVETLLPYLKGENGLSNADESAVCRQVRVWLWRCIHVFVRLVCACVLSLDGAEVFFFPPLAGKDAVVFTVCKCCREKQYCNPPLRHLCVVGGLMAAAAVYCGGALLLLSWIVPSTSHLCSSSMSRPTFYVGFLFIRPPRGHRVGNPSSSSIPRSGSWLALFFSCVGCSTHSL